MNPLLRHIVETYESETAKTASVWKRFADADLAYRPDAKSTTVEGILRHQLLSERRFFAEFLGLHEPLPGEVLPREATVPAFAARLVELAAPRSGALESKAESWWLTEVPFFDVNRTRIWVVWRRILHSAHHRTQLTMYLRMMGKPVPSTYGPTADETWAGADPTNTVEAAGR